MQVENGEITRDENNSAYSISIQVYLSLKGNNIYLISRKFGYFQTYFESLSSKPYAVPLQ
jgi:hypothetical protein